MGKIKFLVVLLFIPFSVRAACDSSKIARYKALASNIDTYASFNGNSFDVTFYNLSNEFRIVNRDDGSSFRISDNFGEYKAYGMNPGKTYTYFVYPNDSDCSTTKVKTFYVDLPYYNSYYVDPVCSNSLSPLCSKWTNVSNVSYDEFVRMVSEYNKNSVIEEEEPDIIDDGYGFFGFLSDYYIYILLFIILAGSVGIYYLNKKQSFDFKV